MPNYIYEKCRNERRGSPNPVVLLHKRAKGSIKSSITVGLKRGGINWEPLYPEGEDETSLKKHVEYPSTITCICSGIDWVKIEKWMIVTFPGRRRIMNSQLPLADLNLSTQLCFLMKK